METNDGLQPQATEQVAIPATQPPPAGSSPTNKEAARKTISIDSLSKGSALTLVFLYVSGFLITSLHNFQYGFSEMNPLRPRILAAGGWFAIFIAVPFAIVWELRNHSSLEDESTALNKHLSFLITYMVSAYLFVFCSKSLFIFADTSVSTGQPSPWWVDMLFLFGTFVVLLVVSVTIVYVAEMLELRFHKPFRFRKWFVNAITIAFFGGIILCEWYAVSTAQLFTSGEIYLWTFLIGGFIYYELSQRGWKPQVDYWHRTLVGLLILMTLFATVYYPHIKAKWGGGAPIPIEITFSKDASVRSGLVLECSLIDETDAGFYVVGKGEASATFIPRAEISSIYYGQGNKHLMFTDNPPQVPVPLNTPPTNQNPPANQPQTTPPAPSHP